ncbi:MAG: sugar porter family MFS transporter [Armatimonadetes bacterium]|nr:sugar porter family MFS transporter [Armatimonadota bacterium]
MTKVLTESPMTGQGVAGRGYTFFIAFVAAIGGFLFGYDTAIIAPAQLFLQKHFNLSPEQLGFAVSVLLLGCIAGPILGAGLCDRLGRKSVLFLSGILFIVGAIGTAVTNSIVVFDIFRFVGGLGLGFASLASPMYIAEISPAKVRGRLGLMFQLAITIGALSATLAAYFIASHYVEGSLAQTQMAWRWMVGSIVIPIIIFLLLLLRVPQSPRWLAGRGGNEEALAILTKINGPEQAAKEMEAIKESLKEESGTFSEIFLPGIRIALVIGILLAVFSNWTGWSGVAYYLPTIFQMAGIPDPSKAIGVALVPMTANVFLSLIAIWLVDRAGRRPIYIATSAAMFVFLILMGLAFQLHLSPAFIVLATLLILIPHAIGLGPLSWLMMSEIFPTRIRARAVSITTTFVWFAGFTGPLAFPKLVEISKATFGSPAGLFWLYAIICVFAFIFALKLLPETKGRTLEEIARSWEKRAD